MYKKREFTYEKLCDYGNDGIWNCMIINYEQAIIEYYSKNESQPSPSILVAEPEPLCIDIAKNYENCIRIYDYNDNYLDDIEISIKSRQPSGLINDIQTNLFQTNLNNYQPDINQQSNIIHEVSSINEYSINQPNLNELFVKFTDINNNEVSDTKSIKIIDTPPNLVIQQPEITTEVLSSQQPEIFSQPQYEDWGNLSDVFKYWDTQPVPGIGIPGVIVKTYQYLQPNGNWSNTSLTPIDTTIVRKNKIIYEAKINGQPDRTNSFAEKIVNFVDTTPPTISLQPSITCIDIGINPPEYYIENG